MSAFGWAVADVVVTVISTFPLWAPCAAGLWLAVWAICETRPKHDPASRLASAASAATPDLDAIAQHHTHLQYGTGCAPAPGSDPWLEGLWALELNDDRITEGDQK